MRVKPVIPPIKSGQPIKYELDFEVLIAIKMKVSAFWDTAIHEPTFRRNLSHPPLGLKIS
jgi:hypothetical protein